MKRASPQRTEPIDAKMDHMLMENQRLKPQMLLLFEQDALMKREKHQAFVRAGFTDDQAFELTKGCA